MKNIPKIIYLQIGEVLEPDNFTDDFSELVGVSWCDERINENDLVYKLVEVEEIKKLF